MPGPSAAAKARLADAAFWFAEAADVLEGLQKYLDPGQSSFVEVAARARGKVVKEQLKLAEDYIARGERLLRAKT